MSMESETSEFMKAIRYHAYGGPEVLRYEDVPRPVEGEGETLVRVIATDVNPGDWQIRSGLAGDRFSLPYIPGWDVSGIVESVGANVTDFRKGDTVYGMSSNSGAYAEYVVVPAKQLAHKPKSISHIEAAGLPMSAFTAWHALFEQGKLESGQTLLVNGAAGGVGHFAVQLAKWKGARVIGVASGRNEKFLRDLGVDQFIDYTTASIEAAAHNVDLVIDTVGGENGGRLLNVLKPGGSLVPITWGHYSTDHAVLASVTLHELKLVQITAEYLNEIGKLIDTGQLHIAIDTVFPLQEARRAHELSESRRVSGKIILQVV